MDAKIQQRRSMEVDLRRALAEGQFELHYQPLINVEKNTINGFEALLRWKHPDQGLPSFPLRFHSARGGNRPHQSAWRVGSSDLPAWRPLPGLKHIQVAVNLSPVQFRTKKLLAKALGALAASGLSPRRLELDITEGVLLVEQKSTFFFRCCMTCARWASAIALDDFGTGYSSLGPSAVLSLRQDQDRWVPSIREFGHGATTALLPFWAITRALAQSLGMMTTAEGVETADQLKLIRARRAAARLRAICSAPRGPPRKSRNFSELQTAPSGLTHLA